MISVVMAASAVVVGVISFISSNKSDKKNRETKIETRQLLLVMQILTQLRSPEFIEQWATVVYHTDSQSFG